MGSFLGAGEPVRTPPYYVSPSGGSLDVGTQEYPINLTTALEIVQSGETIILMDGIYTKDTLVIPAGITLQTDAGARPIIVHSDEKPPAVSIGNGATVDGIWFGGTRPANDTGSRTIIMGQNSITQDCTLFGYINGIQNGSDAHGNIYRRNRFVNCGYQDLWHPLYVANLNSSQEIHGVLSEENIIVGCEGYSVHYYHGPGYGTAQYNFIGGARNGLALQGNSNGPVSGNRNIIWNVSQWPLYNATSLGTCNNNVWRGCPQPDTPDDGNYFVDPVPTAGTNPVVWQEADVVSNLGNSSANIDTAITALETAFAQTMQQIHDDTTIETHFATLKAVIDTWKAA